MQHRKPLKYVCCHLLVFCSALWPASFWAIDSCDQINLLFTPSSTAKTWHILTMSCSRKTIMKKGMGRLHRWVNNWTPSTYCCCCHLPQCSWEKQRAVFLQCHSINLLSIITDVKSAWLIRKITVPKVIYELLLTGHIVAVNRNYSVAINLERNCREMCKDLLLFLLFLD